MGWSHCFVRDYSSKTDFPTEVTRMQPRSLLSPGGHWYTSLLLPSFLHNPYPSSALPSLHYLRHGLTHSLLHDANMDLLHSMAPYCASLCIVIIFATSLYYLFPPFPSPSDTRPLPSSLSLSVLVIGLYSALTVPPF